MRGVGTERVLTDMVSLVRHAVELDDELVPYPELVQKRYQDWLAAHEAQGQTFTRGAALVAGPYRETIGVNLGVVAMISGTGSCSTGAGWIAARRLFGAELPRLLEELNEGLAV